MTPATRIEKKLDQIAAELAAIRAIVEQREAEIKPGGVYDVAELAKRVGRSPRTIYNAINAGFLHANNGVVYGEDAIAWVKQGRPTGRNKGDVQIASKNVKTQ